MTLGWLLTAGNLGYACYGSEDLVWIFFVVFLVVISVLVLSKHVQWDYAYRVDADSTTPNDYAVLVRNLPKSASEEEIAEFFEEEVQRRLREYGLSICDGGASRADSPRSGDSDSRRRAPTEEPSSSKVVVVVIGFVLEKASKGPWKGLTSIQSSGAAVVVFEEKWAAHVAALGHPSTTVQGVIDTLSWESTFSVKRWYNLFGLEKCLYEGRALMVSKAPNPSDIIWENLGSSLLKFVQVNVASNLLVGLLLVFCMWFCKTLKGTMAQPTLECSKAPAQTLNHSARVVIPALGVGLTNLLVKWLSTWISQMEVFCTRTQNMASTMIKLTMCLCVNTCYTPLWLHSLEAVELAIGLHANATQDENAGVEVQAARVETVVAGLSEDLALLAEAFAADQSFSLSPCPKAFYQAGGLVDEMVFTTLTAMFTPALFVLLDPLRIAQNCYRKFVKKAPVKLPEPDLPFYYAQVNTMCILAMCYAPLMPLVIPCAVAGLASMYAASKFSFASGAPSWVRKKQPLILVSDLIYSHAILFTFHVMLLMIPVMTIYFLTPSMTMDAWESLLSHRTLMIVLSVTMYCGMWAGYAATWGKTAMVEEHEIEEERNYYEVQYDWRYTTRHYHITHFLYGSLYGKSIYLERDTQRVSPAAELLDARASLKSGPLPEQALRGRSSRGARDLNG